MLCDLQKSFRLSDRRLLLITRLSSDHTGLKAYSFEFKSSVLSTKPQLPKSCGDPLNLLFHLLVYLGQLLVLSFMTQLSFFDKLHVGLDASSKAWLMGSIERVEPKFFLQLHPPTARFKWKHFPAYRMLAVKDTFRET